MTPLMHAAKSGNPRVVQLLLERGARVDSKDLWGNSPIVFAVWGGNLEVLQALLESGADVNAPNIEGYTPLMLAVLHGRVRIVKALLAHGADPSAKRPWPSGQTALKFAEFRKDTELIAILRDAGAHE